METENNCKLPSPPEEAHYTVYKLTDPEGKIYIGCTGKAVEKRWLKGKGYTRDTPIRQAINRYGWENFRKEILCEKLIREGAEKLEKWFIAYYDSADPEKGYNRYLGGLGKGSKMSEVLKEQFRESRKTFYEDRPGLKDKIRNSINKRYKEDPALRSRISESVKKRWEDSDYRERNVKATCLSLATPEASEKMSSAKKKLYQLEPERKEMIRKTVKDFFSEGGNRAFVHSTRRGRKVMCVETGVIYPSSRAAERILGSSSIHKACSGRLHTAMGYHWRYAE